MSNPILHHVARIIDKSPDSRGPVRLADVHRKSGKSGVFADLTHKGTPAANKERKSDWAHVAPVAHLFGVGRATLGAAAAGPVTMVVVHWRCLSRKACQCDPPSAELTAPSLTPTTKILSVDS